MKEDIKELRIRIDGLSQLTKELKMENKITIETLNRICEDFKGTSLNIRVSNLQEIKDLIKDSDTYTVFTSRDSEWLTLKHFNGTIICFDVRHFNERLKQISIEIFNRHKDKHENISTTE